MALQQQLTSPTPPLLRPLLQLTGKQVAAMVLPRSNRRMVQIQATANASRKKNGLSDDILMVDPLEAKRLAAEQMEEIKSRERFKRQRQIEAINGAWAVIGLTAGLVIEGQTGKSFLAQLLTYWNAVISYFGE